MKTGMELRKYERSPQRRVQWNWADATAKYFAEPRRFELAIWHKEMTLCGVSLGKLSGKGGKLRPDFIEAHPDGSALDGLITKLIIDAALVYAKVIGAEQIRITNPINDRVRDHCLSFDGFQFDKHNNFCYRDVNL